MVHATIPSSLMLFYEQGFFQQERNFESVMKKLSTLGSHPTPQNLNNALSRTTFLRKLGKPGQYRYIQKHAPKSINHSRDILPDELMKALAQDFKTELVDLKHNFGISGNCTAFLLRKILEKLIFIVFAKNGQEAALFDPNGKLVGLQSMLAIATTNRAAGKPFLMHKTVEELRGVKFLGDTAAHNPLANVSMKTILPVMPFIVTAYSELAAKL